MDPTREIQNRLADGYNIEDIAFEGPTLAILRHRLAGVVNSAKVIPWGPDSKAVKDGFVFLVGYVFRQEDAKKTDEVKRRDDFEHGTTRGTHHKASRPRAYVYPTCRTNC